MTEHAKSLAAKFKYYTFSIWNIIDLLFMTLAVVTFVLRNFQQTFWVIMSLIKVVFNVVMESIDSDQQDLVCHQQRRLVRQALALLPHQHQHGAQIGGLEQHGEVHDGNTLVQLQMCISFIVPRVTDLLSPFGCLYVGLWRSQSVHH